MDRDVLPLTQGNWLVVMLIAIGVYTLYYAVIDSVYWVYVSHMSAKSTLTDTPYLMRAEDTANLILSIIEVVISALLILKAKTISVFLLKVSK